MEALVYLDKATMEETVSQLYPGLRPDQLRSKKRQCYTWKATKRDIGSRQDCRAWSRGMGATAAEEQLV
ncbi:hypothetical protein JG687_00011716 [Phytophthora cactorum]|uniref:Uncharacterized protein n=1 Tax=Phytophthora cactorum TaxID=29920 RepID=A0A329T0W9_9STRA|nr:hypothetical protein Pcac1_g11401 [Phytophthora cactorum]KAG2805756.1 hypothetical protein PC112_g18127 [Phytophthora cactorum]KAG2807149.1 hypothetical protein PC111_g17047 [Phytophthora cactorum]KAG2846164.1 hypothetical protein PC113_g18030 [Phytophthora cactorum]KAG2883469.1 hypothetical protein PC114_g20580 [Phytophthora cactorum]